MIEIIDTHAHLEGEEFADDLQQVIERAKEAGVKKAFLPAIHLESIERIIMVCNKYPDFAYPMVGLHPEEVKEDYLEVLSTMKSTYLKGNSHPFIAIGEVGLDYYWSREFETQQLEAFEEQVRWSVDTQLPLMIHCRKAQNEMVKILRKYDGKLLGGVFHCFTGNEIEARELLSFDNFVLGIGGVLTFKKSHLPEVLPAVVPLDRIVLETDSPYMAPVPHRGKRNESAFVVNVLDKLAESYQVSKEEIALITNQNVKRVFGI
jgi:TatD DNase family protein